MHCSMYLSSSLKTLISPARASLISLQARVTSPLIFSIFTLSSATFLSARLTSSKLFICIYSPFKLNLLI